jgi:hypothetical protein
MDEAAQRFTPVYRGLFCIRAGSGELEGSAAAGNELAAIDDK